MTKSLLSQVDAARNPVGPVNLYGEEEIIELLNQAIYLRALLGSQVLEEFGRINPVYSTSLLKRQACLLV